MSVGPLPTLAAEMAGHGIAGGNVHCAINLISLPLRAPRRICSAGPMARARCKNCSPLKVSVTPFECRSNNFRPTSASSALSDAVTADCGT
jgi:hypothetical protein